jgi:SAM-dependent methyltransferase
MPRADVASHFSDPGLILSGFTATIPLGATRCGIYSVHLIQESEAGTYRNENVLRFSVALESYERSARVGLARKYLKGTGIEIGALQRKLEAPSGCTVRYVDRMGLDELRAHYPELNGVTLQVPDIIDDGERLTRFSDGSLDFVIANHFLEHCENPAKTLGNFLRLLRPKGIVYMAIPDKRSTFDYTRPCTRWDVLKQTFFSGRRRDRIELYQEWAAHVMKYEGNAADETARKLADESYSIHFNVWDLETLLNFLAKCRSELALPFATSAVVSSENETIVILERV